MSATIIDDDMLKAADAYMAEYQNILAPGKEPHMTKKYKPKVAHKMDKYLDPNSLKRHVLKSDKVQKLIELYSEQTHISKREVQKQVVNILDEIGLARSLAVIRWCGIAISALGKRITSGIYVNEKNLNTIKEGLGNYPVLYLPSHRSYLDFILMSYICFHYDVEIPGIAAGMDFHAMVGMGTVLRKTGAFFMRRSFSGDELYWDVFREYIYALVKDYHIGLEFFIEGTRSRNFKALVPKVGLLSMALQPFFMGEVSDITIVPVSVSYEKVLEEQLFVYELLGVPKPKESTKGFFKALKIIDQQFGRMYMDFGEPISVKEYFGEDLDRVRHASLSPHLQKLNKNEIQLIKGLANEVVHCQQKRIVITTFNLIAVYFSYNINAQQRMTLDKLCEGVQMLKSVFNFLGAHVATDCNGLKSEIIETTEVHSNIITFNRGVLELSNEDIAMDGIDPRKMKGHSLSKDTMEIAVPSLSLQLYINPCMFWLAEPAILVLTFMKLEEDMKRTSAGIRVIDLKNEISELNEVFSNEFIFEKQTLSKDFQKNLNFLQKFGVFTVTAGQATFERNEISDILLSVIAPFLFIYFQLTETLLAQPPINEFTQKDILIYTQKNIENLLSLPGALYVHPYCLAIDNLNTAITSFVQQGYLLKTKDTGAISCRRDSVQMLNSKLLQYCRVMPLRQFYNTKKDIILKSKL